MKKYFYYILLLLGVVIMSGCGAKSIEMIKMDTSTAEERALQIKSYESGDYLEVFSASLATMQDLGFHIDFTDKELGVISASKSRDAAEIGEQTMGFIAALLGANISPALKASQDIRATVVVASNNKSNYVRLTLQRILYNIQGGVIGMESVKDAEIYNAFFEKLSKGIFLEDNL